MTDLWAKASQLYVASGRLWNRIPKHCRLYNHLMISEVMRDIMLEHASAVEGIRLSPRS